MDTDVSDDIVASLDVAAGRYSRGSAAQANVLRNFEYFQAVHHRMKASHYNNWWQWQSQWGPQPSVAGLNANMTSSTVNPINTSPNLTTTIIPVESANRANSDRKGIVSRRHGQGSDQEGVSAFLTSP